MRKKETKKKLSLLNM